MYLEFIDQQIKLNQKRSDYLEMLQLGRMFITNEIKYPIKSAGADSQSRWMSKFFCLLKFTY